MNVTLKQHPMSAMLGRLTAILFLLVAFLTLTRVISDISFVLAGELYSAWYPIDPDGAFLTITLHHLFQAAMAFVFIVALARVLRIPLADFGFSTHQWRYAVKRVLQFCAVWFIMQGSIATLMMLSGTMPVPFPFPLSAANFSRYFLFQILLSGSSEEILFRALVIPLMLLLGRKIGYGEKATTALAILVATLGFMFGHINFSLNPFRITYINWLQQATVITLGLFYAFLFVKTRSLVGPILAHNLLNGVIVMIGLLMILFFP